MAAGTKRWAAGLLVSILLGVGRSAGQAPAPVEEVQLTAPSPAPYATMPGVVLRTVQPNGATHLPPPVHYADAQPEHHGDGPEPIGLFSETICDMEPGGFYLSAEYLLLKPRRQFLDFAIADPLANGIPSGTVEAVKWDTDSGVRVGGLHRLNEAGWEIGAFYTYFRSDGHQALAAAPGGELFATTTHPGAIERVDVAVADTSIRYHVIDVEIGRRFGFGESFLLRLFGGGRWVFIDQAFDVFYNGGDALNAKVSMPVDFDGGGLRAGGQIDWKCYYGFRPYCRGSYSLLLGNFETINNETTNFGATTNARVADNSRQMVPVLELGAGLAWEYKHLRVSVGYEMVNYFNMVQGIEFVDDMHQGKFERRVGDLSLVGMNVQAGLSF